ncbi:MAG: hypothetical protein WC838_02340 [Candidatus Margulisiibacteriota bacterium]|jgi:hypothetical protein
MIQRTSFKINASGSLLAPKYRQELLRLAANHYNRLNHAAVKWQGLFIGLEAGRPKFDLDQAKLLPIVEQTLKQMAGEQKYQRLAAPLLNLAKEIDQAIHPKLSIGNIPGTKILLLTSPPVDVPTAKPQNHLIFKAMIDNISTHDRHTTACTTITGVSTPTDTVLLGDLQRMTGKLTYDPRCIIQGQELPEEYPEKRGSGSGKLFNWIHTMDNAHSGLWILDLKHYNWRGQTEDQGKLGALKQEFTGFQPSLSWYKGGNEINLSYHQRSSQETAWPIGSSSRRDSKSSEFSCHALFKIGPKLSLGPIIEQTSGFKTYHYIFDDPQSLTACLTPDYTLNYRQNAFGLKGKYTFNKQRSLEFWGKVFRGTRPESELSRQKHNGSFQTGLVLNNKQQSYGFTYDDLSSRGKSVWSYPQDLSSDQWESHQEKNYSLFFKTTGKKSMAPTYKISYTLTQKKDASDGIFHLPTGAVYSPTSVDRKSHIVGLTITKPLPKDAQIELEVQKTFGQRKDRMQGQIREFGNEGGSYIGISYSRAF